jgi:putative tryptophan/tyrosine transport system substrate-binding protein
MRRLSFIVVATLALASAAAPGGVVLAQQPSKAPRIGYLGNQNPKTGASSLNAFRQGLRELGWVEGQNVAIEFRWADGNFDRFAALAGDLVKVPVDVIVLAGSPAIRGARQATTTIPIVAAIMGDPLSAGFAVSFARPGGNITGLAAPFEGLISKQLQILRETLPKAAHVAILFHTPLPASQREAAETAAHALSLKAQVLEIRDIADVAGAFKAATTGNADAMLVMPSPLFNRHRARLAELAIKHRLPAIYEVTEYVMSGGLMSYGPSFTDMYRRAASYVDRILKGARPADLPIEQPSQYEFVVNARAARAIGLTFPPQVLLRVNQVID